jgi:hypothetical protein
MEETETRTSRPRFLKQVAMTLAAAVGAGALAARAQANPGQCCYNCTDCGSCSGGCFCFCDCTGIGQSYCWTAGQACIEGGCRSCPC